MGPVSKYSSFVKIEHSLFSLPLLFSGTLLAGRGWPSLRLTLLILIAGVTARVVALGLNRIIDRHIDKHNPRTQERHLAKGTMNLWEAWSLVIVNLFMFVFACWLISDLCLKLSWIPIVAFASYPYFKRFTRWAHVGLGLVWSLVPMAGYLAVKPSLEGFWPVVVLGLFCVLWLAGFDIIYATQDEDFDREHSLHSLPASLGSEKALKLAALFHFLAFGALIVLYGGWFSGPITVLLLLIVGVFLYWEQRVTRHIDLAFFKINAVIGFIVFFFVLSGLKGY